MGQARERANPVAKRHARALGSTRARAFCCRRRAQERKWEGQRRGKRGIQEEEAAPAPLPLARAKSRARAGAAHRSARVRKEGTYVSVVVVERFGVVGC